jgi:hypothetical protein
VTVTVYRTDGSAAGAAPTGDGGAYTFSGLLPGTYYLVFGDLPGYARTLAYQGAFATDSDANPTSGRTGNISLAAGESDLTIDAGYGQAAILGGLVWHDQDLDGQQDPGEPGIYGATVNLYRPGYGPDGIPGTGDDEALIATTVTATGGSYSFSSLPAGIYVVGFGDIPGYARTLANQGPDDSDSDADPSTGLTGSITLAYGDTNTTIDGGFANATISGQVRQDTDGDGDPADPDYPIVNVTIGLYLDVDGDGFYDPGDDTLSATTTTDANGRYTFPDVPLGRYVVVETDPATYTSTYDYDGPANTLNTIAVDALAAAVYPGRDFLDKPPETPTVAVVSRFGVSLEEFGLVVRWWTASEVGSVAFSLYREVGPAGDTVLVTPEPILAVGEPQGGTYAVLDEGAMPGEICRYWLEEQQTVGGALLHGPFVLTLPLAAGAVVEVAGDGVSPVPLPAASGRRAKMPAAEGPALGAAAYAADGRKPARAAARLEEAALAAIPTAAKAVVARPITDAEANRTLQRLTNRMRIPVTARGVHYLPVGAVASGLGIDEAVARYGLRTRSLRLTCRQAPVGYLVAGAGDGLYFHGLLPESPYTKTSMYWLAAGSSPSPGTVSGGAPAPVSGGSFLDVLHLEQDSVSLVGVVSRPEDGMWAWGSLRPAIPAFSTRKVYPVLTALAPPSGQAGLIVRLHGGSDSPAAFDHQIEISVNGTPVGSTQWDGLTPHTAEFQFPASLLVAGTNTIAVRAVLAEGVSSSTCYLDWVDVVYPRTFAAVADQLGFTADGNAVITVTGFSQAGIQVFDITDPGRTVALSNLTLAAGPLAGTYSASFRPANPKARYVAFVPSAARSASGVRVPPSTLPILRGRMPHLVIAPTDMVAASESLASHRRSGGLQSLVVDLQDVYNEYGDGLPEPTAIAAFIAKAYQHLGGVLRYVVLVGDGTYDYCNLQGRNDNLLPPLLTHTAYGLFASDVSLGDVVGSDARPEVAVGRLPVMNAAELSALIAKIVAYESALAGASPLDVVLGADVPDQGGDFPLDADAIAAGPLAGAALQRVYLSELPLADARSQLFGLMTAGARYVNWLGHGGMDRLSPAGLLTTADVPALTIPSGRLPVLVAASCVINRFEIPGYDGLGEHLVLKADGGAVAVWAPSALAYNVDSRSLDRSFYEAVYRDRQQRLGDAVIQALRGLAPVAMEPKQAVDARRVYTLLGDPGLRLQTTTTRR